MKTLETHEGFRNVEWESSDLALITNDEATELLMRAAAANVEYYSNMVEHRHASDDDTDYMNCHSELMLAVNAFWYDGVDEQLLDWLNGSGWGSLLDDDTTVPTTSKGLIDYIINSIAR